MFCCQLPITMALRLLRGGWYPTVYHPSGVLRNVQKGCIPGSVHILLTALTNPQGSAYYTWYAQLLKVPMIHLRFIAEVLTQYYSATIIVRHFPLLLEVNLCTYLSSYWLISVTFVLVVRQKTTYVVKTSCIVQEELLGHENSCFSCEREMIAS